MLKQTKKLIAVAFCVSVSASCGGPAGTTSAKSLRAALSFAANLIEDFKLNGAPSVSAVPGLGTATFAFSSSPCDSTVTPDPLVDADGDGVPVQAKYTYNCSNADIGGGTIASQKGYYKISDKDDAKKWSDGGYKGEWDYAFKSTYPASGNYSGGSYVYSGTGSYDLTQIGGSQVYTSVYKGEVGFTTKLKSGSYTYDGTWKVKITPNGTPTYNAGKMEYDGVWRISGTLPEEEEQQTNKKKSDGSVDAEITVSSSNLTYDSSCSKWFKTGKIIYHDIAGGVFESRFDCTSVKYYYNGEEYDPAA